MNPFTFGMSVSVCIPTSASTKPTSAAAAASAAASPKIMRTTRHRGHPTARKLNKRPGADVDIERVVERAVATGTALEINSQPDRLDLRDTHARLAGEAGAWLCVNTDAHEVHALGWAEIGVGQARRAWLTAERILNTRPWAEIERLRK